MNQVTVKKGLPTWAIVLIVLVVAAPVVIGILSALAIYGVRKYMVSAKRAEATHMLAAWSTGMVACGERDGLPPSSPAVPLALSAISGSKYQSAPGDWSAPAFSCAGFAMADPQYFQYQWLQESPSRGAMIALADLNADGSPEERLEVQVSCAGSRCTASPLPAR